MSLNISHMELTKHYAFPEKRPIKGDWTQVRQMIILIIIITDKSRIFEAAVNP